MDFKFEVTVSVEREQGRFMSRDAVADELREALEGADPQEVSDGDSTYAVTDWSVTGGERP